MIYFIDTNIAIYGAGKESKYKKRCISIMEALSHGEIRGVMSVEVYQEILALLNKFFYTAPIRGVMRILEV